MKNNNLSEQRFNTSEFALNELATLQGLVSEVTEYIRGIATESQKKFSVTVENDHEMYKRDDVVNISTEDLKEVANLIEETSKLIVHAKDYHLIVSANVLLKKYLNSLYEFKRRLEEIINSTNTPNPKIENIFNCHGFISLESKNYKWENVHVFLQNVAVEVSTMLCINK